MSRALPPARVLATAGVLYCCVGVSEARAQLNLWNVPEPRNGPGLRCWGVRAGMNSATLVYAQPTPGARVLGVTHAMVAATGAPVGGFVPVITSVGVRGYVLEREVARDRWSGLSCVVHRDSVTGHLTFGYSVKAVP